MARRLYNYPRPYPQLDISGGLQIGTSHLLRKRNEVAATKNAVYNAKIGSAKRRDGYEKVGNTIQQGKDSLYSGVFRFGTNSRIMAATNNSDDSNAVLAVLDTGDYWTPLISNAQANTRFQCLTDNDEFFVAGASDNNVYLPLTNINSALSVSQSHNVYTAPASKFIAEYNGELYAINCYLNGKYYPDRFYKSSPLLGAITNIQTDQSGLLKQLRVDDIRYIKVGMQLDVYTGGTEAKQVSAITVISVDKKNNRFSFLDTQITVKDNDEVWLTGTKGTLSRYWNTDFRTPETADWERVPPGKEARPAFTGHGKNNNRLFLFTKNTFLKWDGANLITVSDTIGCVSHETIQNIGSWTIWLHTTGVWGYNDTTGQFKLLSRAVDPYIKAINQINLSKTSAGVSGRIYKLSLGELLPIDDITTSTSTSSTSTSSTSSSTSSTSTSSTSTSSTSTSTSLTTSTTSTSSTSASTTSASTSSTSSSSTSSSVSTSTSSTTTTTVASTKKVVRLCYDFDLNSWWTEEHKREIRFQFNYTMSGYTKPYFSDETGRLFRDETGNTDNGDSIPMEIEWGRNTFGTGEQKKYLSLILDSERARGGSLQYSLDGAAFQTFKEQINNNIVKMIFPQHGQLVEGRDINYKFVHNDKGDPPIINGLTTYFSQTELMVNEGQ